MKNPPPAYSKPAKHRKLQFLWPFSAAFTGEGQQSGLFRKHFVSIVKALSVVDPTSAEAEISLLYVCLQQEFKALKCHRCFA